MSIYNYKPKGKKAIWYKPPAAPKPKPQFSSIKRKPWSSLGAGLLTKKKLKNYATAFSTTEDAPKRKPVRKESKALASARRSYRARVKVWLEGKMCAVFQHLPATECHHKFGRSGRLLLWEPGWVALSKAAHEMVHSQPEWARKFGLFGPLGTWNDFDRAYAYERNRLEGDLRAALDKFEKACEER